MCDEAGIFNCTSLVIGFIYVWLCSPQASNNNNNNNNNFYIVEKIIIPQYEYNILIILIIYIPDNNCMSVLG